MGLFRRRNDQQPAPVTGDQLPESLAERLLRLERRQDQLEFDFTTTLDKINAWSARQRRRDQVELDKLSAAAPDATPTDIAPSAEFTREQKKAILRQRLRGA